MIIRREQPEDARAITAVHDAAFTGPRTQGTTAESRLVEDLREQEDAVPRLCLVAADDGQVVGHVMCSRGRVEGIPLLALGPIGVRPSDQGKGVGSALMHAVLAAAEALEEPAVFVLGDPAYYERFGFEAATGRNVQPADDSWGSDFQVRIFGAWDEACAGTFEYPAAFSRL